MDSEVFAWQAILILCGILFVGGYFFLLGYAARSSFKHMEKHINDHKNDRCDGFLG